MALDYGSNPQRVCVGCQDDYYFDIVQAIHFHHLMDESLSRLFALGTEAGRSAPQVEIHFVNERKRIVKVSSAEDSHYGAVASRSPKGKPPDSPVLL
jgi:hypothetical protein